MGRGNAMAEIADEHERTMAFAEIALGQLKALRQAATPRNYEIWYTYATGYSPSLNQTINETLARSGTLSDADLEQIYANFISPTRLTDKIDTVGARVMDEINQVMSMMDAATGSANNYTESLADVTNKLGNTKDRDGIRAIVESLVQTASEMKKDNHKLEQRLSASKQEINQLQENLEVVRNESLTDPLTGLSNRKYFDMSLNEALDGVDAVVLSVSDTPDVEELLLGPNAMGGAVSQLRAGAIVIDTSTIAPSATRRIGSRLAENDILMVDAPVSGGSEGAVNGTLTVFLGGAADAVALAEPMLRAFAKTITHLGPLGAGQVGKAVNQLVISGSYLSLAEGILVGQRAGLDPATLAAALAGGAAKSWVLDNRWQRMAEDRYPLGFKVSLHRKDLGIAIELAKEVGVPVPAATLVAQLEDALVAAGRGGDDLSALAHQLRRMADALDA